MNLSITQIILIMIVGFLLFGDVPGRLKMIKSEYLNMKKGSGSQEDHKEFK